jgi:hypothetical protein
MWDWEFNGNLLSTNGGLDLAQASGSPAYTNTPLYVPYAVAVAPNTPQCFTSQSLAVYTPFCTTATGSIRLASSAWSPNEGDAATVAWSQTSGPSTATITNGTTFTPTVSALTAFGQYNLQLAATNSQGSTNASLAVGSTTATGCQISDVPTNLQYIIGPLTPWGRKDCNPYQWFDVAEAANAQSLPAMWYTTPTVGNTPAAGTIDISLTTHPVQITGTGTHFLTDVVDISSGRCYGTSPNRVPTIAIWGTAAGVAGASHRITNVGTGIAPGVIDDTHMTLGDDAWSGLPPYTGLQYSVLNADDYCIAFSLSQRGTGGSYSWNYYDVALAYYRLYYRTGITQFLTFGRQLADDWWSYFMAAGYQPVQFPRLWSMASQMVRALEAHPERWVGIENQLDTSPARNPVSTQPIDGPDWRESGYYLAFAALAAANDPNAGEQAHFCSAVAGLMPNWLAAQTADGSYRTSFYSGNQTYIDYTQGTAVLPYQMSIVGAGLREAYRVLTGPCADPTTAASTLSAAKRVAAWAYNAGANGQRTIPAANGGGTGRTGLSFEVGVQSSGQNSSGATLGTVSGVSGGTVITGTGTNFTTRFACNSTDVIGINNEFRTHLVVSCADATHMTVFPALISTVSGSPYGYAPFDSAPASSCLPSSTDYCFSPGDPTLFNDMGGMFGWLYATTGDAKYRAWGEDFFSVAFGAQDDGPGGSLPATGPRSNGGNNDPYGYLALIGACAQIAPPCGGLVGGTQHDPMGGGPAGSFAKNFGIGSGYAGGNANFLAWRLMEPNTHRFPVVAK